VTRPPRAGPGTGNRRSPAAASTNTASSAKYPNQADGNGTTNDDKRTLSTVVSMRVDLEVAATTAPLAPATAASLRACASEGGAAVAAPSPDDGAEEAAAEATVTRRDDDRRRGSSSARRNAACPTGATQPRSRRAIAR
jgi:hypothetical protein